MDDMAFFECPECGGSALAKSFTAELVEFIGASVQHHATCDTTLVALPLDYGRSMESYEVMA